MSAVTDPTRKKKTTSGVWLYFTQKDNEAVCKTCGHTRAFKSSSNMWTHLRSKHGFVGKSPPQAKGALDKFVTKDSNTISAVEQQRLDGLIVEMIVKDCSPFSIVERKGFGALCSGLNKNYKLPSQRTVTSLFEKLQQEKVQKVCHALILC